MKAVPVLIGAAAVAAGVVIWFGRHEVLSSLDRQEWAANHPTYGPPLHVGQPGGWEWAWPRDGWPSAGEVQCKLVLSPSADIPREHYDRDKMPLRLRVRAHQTSGAGRKQVLDTRFPVDRPDVGSSFAISGYSNDQVEHTLGTVYLDPVAQTSFSVDVEVGDAILESAQPRFMVVGAYDYAAFPMGGILLLVRDVVAGALALGFLTVGVAIAWPRSSLAPRASATQGPERSR